MANKNLYVHTGLDVNGNILFTGNFFGATGSGYWVSGNNTYGAGIYGDGATGNVLRLQAGGSERMRIDSSGNVGIGTSSPERLLDVVGTARLRGDVDIFSPTGGAVNSVFQYFGSAALPRAAAIYSKTDSATAGNLVLATAQSGTGTITERMRIDSSGNVGIGTSSPGAKLHVVGNTYVQSGTIFTDAITSYGGTSLALNGGNTLTALTSGTERMRIDSSGNVGIGTASPRQRLHVAGNTIIPITNSYYCYNSDYGLGTPDSSGLQLFAANGDTMRFGHRSSGTFSERMRIDASGPVIAYVDMRSPIFYDSANTGYYVDPASTSVLTTVYARKTAANNSPAIEVRGANPGHPRIQTYGLDADANAWMGLGTDMGGGPYEHSVYFPYGTSGQGKLSIGDYNGTTYNPRLWVYQTYTQIDNSTRSPLFYDSNDTGYYVDPTSTGTSYRGRGEIYLGPNNSNGRFLGLGGDPGSTDEARVAASNGNLHIDSKAGYDLYLNWYSGRPVWSEGGAYFPIYYDRSNTAYYCDPASISRMRSFILGGNAIYVYESATNALSIRTGASGSYNYYGFGSDGRLTINNGGLTATSDVRGTIFYDQNNTAYFVDPASGSTLAGQLNQYGYFNIRYGGSAYAGMQISNTFASASNFATSFIDFSNENSSQKASIFGNFGTDGSGSLQFLSTAPGVGRSTDSRTTTAYAYSNQWQFLTSSGITTNIIYDRDNTARYLDPTGSSYIQGDFYVVRNGNSNDAFGGLEIRENSFQGAGTGAATEAPGINFHWSARTAARIYLNSGGAFVLGGQDDITNNRRTLFCADLNATGNVTAYYSDERLKTKLGNIDNAIDIIKSLNGFRYVNNDVAKQHGYDSDRVQLGISAQEVEVVLPEIVDLAAFDIDVNSPEKKSKTGENYKTVQYDRLVPVLIEAVKEQQEIIDEQNAKINMLEEKLNSIISLLGEK